jgi:nicotinate-nucleotide pyrophosphorylase (carboxylating)
MDGFGQGLGSGSIATLPPWVCLDDQLIAWIKEDVGRGDVTTQGLLLGSSRSGGARWVAKMDGVVAGLPVLVRLYELLDSRVEVVLHRCDGEYCPSGTVIAEMRGPLASLLMGERVALNLVMRLSGIATMTRQYVDVLADLPVSLVDTRKTTPGLRVFEKYASRIGGAMNHRMGLDDAVMLKDNHLAIMESVEAAVSQVRSHMPYPLSIEVEAETIEQVEAALLAGADIVMLDNMPLERMRKAVQIVRNQVSPVKLEASGNITLETIRAVAETGVDYISTSATMTRSPWMDISMKFEAS